MWNSIVSVPDCYLLYGFVNVYVSYDSPVVSCIVVSFVGFIGFLHNNESETIITRISKGKSLFSHNHLTIPIILNTEQLETKLHVVKRQFKYMYKLISTHLKA